jgi:hypothetical protein
MEQRYRRFVLRDHLQFVERALRESETKGIILTPAAAGIVPSNAGGARWGGAYRS